MRQCRSQGTIALHARHLRYFGTFLTLRGTQSLADVTPEVLAAWRDQEMSREKKRLGKGPLSAVTLASNLTVLRGFFKNLLRRGILLLDPAADIQSPRKPRRLPRAVPTARQMKKLLSAPDTKSPLGKRDRAILELLYSSGLRNAELCALMHRDLDMARRTVFIRHGKGDKERLVPFGSGAERALLDYLGTAERAEAELGGGEQRVPERASASPLFPSASGRPLTRCGLARVLERHRGRAGLPLRATPHSLRHACATHLLKGGAGIRQIQALLGHESLSSTEIYTKVETSDLRSMLDRYHPRGRA